MRLPTFLLGLACLISTLGCYLPPGTTQVTGGSGQSAFALSSVNGYESAVETKISATCSIKIDQVEEGGEDDGYYVSGVVNWQDKNFKLQVKANPVFAPVGYTGGPGISVFAEVDYRFGNEKFKKGWAIISLGENTNLSVPGQSKKLDVGRHNAGLVLYDGLEDSDPIYVGFGDFPNGNFVYHGQKGIILH